MRKPLIGLLVACFVGFVLMAPSAVDKCCEHDEGKCCEWLKEAKIGISNIENGVMIKITSDEPEVVKSIQECADKCIIGCKHDDDGDGHCFLIKTGSTEINKSCEVKKCTTDNPGSCCSENESKECKKTCNPEECKKTCNPEECKKP